MTGGQIKDILEDVCDNLFKPPTPIISRAATWCGSAAWPTLARRWKLSGGAFRI